MLEQSLVPKTLNPVGETTKTTCPYCGVGCGVLATPVADEQGKISIDIKGDPDHPSNFGRLCSKGSALGETVDLDGRLLYPSINGARSDWETTLKLVADKFSDTIKKHGPNSVAFYVSGQILSEDYYVANKLMKGFIGSANIDTNSRLCMASSVAGHKKAFGTDTVPGTYEDLEHADLIVLVGSNLAWCHPVIYQRIAAAKEQRPNLKVVLVDPRRTMTNDLADLHLAIRPDGDCALFSGLLAHLENNKNLDQNYIDNYTNGFDAALNMASDLSLENIIEQTGLSADEINQFYTMFAETQKTVTVYSQGVNQSVSGTDKVSAIINCHLATGRIGKIGMGPFSITGQPNAMGGREVGGLANTLACHMDLENEDHRNLVQTFWDAPTIATSQGAKAVEMFDKVASGDIKAIWIMATNPVDSLPNSSAVEAALEKCPFVVVSDVVEHTDTIRYANVKLPALAWGEKDGTVTNSERRISHQKAFLSAPSEATSDWWQMCEVAKHMGFATAFNYTNVSEIFKEYAALSAHQNNDTRDFDIGAYADIANDEYETLKPFLWPLTKDTAQKGNIISNHRFFAQGNFYTTDRKARFIAVEAKQSEVTEFSFPLALNTGRVRDHWHTMTRTAKTPRLSAHMAEPFCEIHPKDAQKYKIQEAGIVEVESAIGAIRVRALITDRVQEGAVFVPLHWTDQYASNGRVDKLVPPVLDPFSGQPAYKNTGVIIRPFEAKTYGFAICRELPKEINAPYWAKAKCIGGWRIEFAFAKKQDTSNLITNILGLKKDDANISFEDETSGIERFVWFNKEQAHQMEAAIFVAPTPVEVSRSWAVDLLSTRHEDPQERFRIIAGRPSQDVPDKGAIVCSCFFVGANEIADAVKAGNISVQAIGKCLNAGTNCGSCKSEISQIISENQAIAAE